MWINFQISADLRQQVSTNFLPAVIERGEFVAKVQPAVASLSLVCYELAPDLRTSRQSPQRAFELRAPHSSRIGQFCPNVNPVPNQRFYELLPGKLTCFLVKKFGRGP